VGSEPTGRAAPRGDAGGLRCGDHLGIHGRDLRQRSFGRTDRRGRSRAGKRSWSSPRWLRRPVAPAITPTTFSIAAAEAGDRDRDRATALRGRGGDRAHGQGVCDREPFLGQSRPVLARTGRRIDAGGNVKALSLTTVARRGLPPLGPQEAIAWQRFHGGRPASVRPAW
jgi:hypothetical protein